MTKLRLLFVGLSVLSFEVSAFANPVTVFIGGFGSCKFTGRTSEIAATKQMDDVVASMTTAARSKTLDIRACYAVGSDTIYVTSPEMDVFNDAMSRHNFYDIVRTVIDRAGKDSPVYVWGFSHGGWTAMDMAARMTDIPFRMMMTVDPISIVDCDAGDFVDGYIFGAKPGCLRAPTDLNGKIPAMKRHTAQWINWYQTQFKLLHSGPISAASQNIRLIQPKPTSWVGMGEHKLMLTDPKLWSDVKKRAVVDVQKFRK